MLLQDFFTIVKLSFCTLLILYVEMLADCFLLVFHIENLKKKKKFHLLRVLHNRKIAVLSMMF